MDTDHQLIETETSELQYLSTDQGLGEGSTVHRLVSLSGRAIAMTARVVYSRPYGERWDSGVEFVDIDASDLAFLKSKLPDGALKE